MNERPDIEQIKAQLAAEIVRLISEQGLTEAAAKRQVGVSEAEIVRLRAAEVRDFSIDRLIEILNRFNQRVGVYVAPAPAAPTRPAARNPLLSIMKRMAEIDAKIPPEELAKVPTDLAQNLDHYLYGAKKSD